jgi:hypothetical protein
LCGGKKLRKILSVLFALVLALSLSVVAVVPVWAATLYEHYNTGDDNVWGFYGQYWKAQTFSAESDHVVGAVKLKLWRSGSPGDLTVSIKATDGSGHPTGADLTSGTISANTLTTNTAGAWYEVSLTPYSLTSGTKYAIVARALGGDDANRVWWRLDESSPTYADGNVEHNADNGVNWTTYADRDFMFEVWDEVAAPSGSVGGTLYPVNKLAVLAPWFVTALLLALGVAIVVVRRLRAN